jgi:peptide/nickel transport system substrate-binding protein
MERMAYHDMERLVARAMRHKLTRRATLKRGAALGLSVPAVSMLLAACGDDGDAPAATPTVATGGGTTPTAATGATPAAGNTPTGGDATATEGTGAATTPTTGGTGQTGGQGGIINVPSTAGDKGVGNPILNANIDWVRFLAFSRLFIYDDEGSLVPQLADNWEYSQDGLELTVALKQAKWHDGEDCTADDVVFTFDAINKPETDTGLRSRLRVAGETITWEKIDDATIKLTTPAQFAPLLFNLTQIAIIPEHILGQSPDINTDPFNQQPIGTGWFRIVEYAQSEFIRFERFDDHFDGPPAADGFTVFFHADTDATDAALRAGNLDMMFTPPEAQPNWENAPGFTLRNYVYFTPITLAYNHKHPVLSDLRVRQAIAMGIDKPTLTDTVTKGRGLVANNQYADTGPLDRYNDYDNVQPVEYDVDAANALLDEAGYARGSNGVRVAPDGTPLSFTIITYSGFEEYVNVQNVLQDMLSDIGIELTPQVVEYTTLEQMWADPEDDPNNRALELEEWPHPFEFDPDVYDELHSDSLPDAGSNYMWFVDEEVDRLIEEGRQETDPDARVGIYRQLDVRRAETLPAFPLYIAVDGWVTSDVVQGMRDTPYFRQYRWVEPNTWYKA